MRLELVAHAGAGSLAPWAEGPLPEGLAVRGIRSVALRVGRADPSLEFLTGTLGFRREGEANGRVRLATGEPGPGTRVEVFEARESLRASLGSGSIHHLAFRTPDDAAQLAWRGRLAEQGVAATAVQDRQYFHSIYFREPGGVLFEIATDPPGFTLDETPEQLGSALRLPPWLEPERSRIENSLPRIRVPLSTRS